MKKILAALCLCAVALLTGCGQAAGGLGIETVTGGEEKKTVQEIYESIIDKVDLYEPVKMSEAFISSYYGIDIKKLEEYVFSISEAATSAETIVIMKVKEEKDTAVMEEILQTVLHEKRNEMENYLPQEFAIVDKSRVRTVGNYVFLVISDKEEAITGIIESEL